MNGYYVPALIGNLMLIVIPAAGALFVGLRSAGRTRVLAVAGCIVLALAGLGYVILEFASMAYNGSNSPTVVGVSGLMLSVVQGIGLALLIMAAVAARPIAAPPPQDPNGYPPGPANYQGPWSQS